MTTHIHDLIDRQLRRWELERSVRRHGSAGTAAPTSFQPVITVSRERGAGGTTLAARLAERFQYTLLDRDVVDRICESSGTVRRVVESLDEHVKSQVTSFCEALLGSGYLDASDYVRHLLAAIRSISELGGAVVVGRGANFIVGPERGFHVRVVAPQAVRIERVMARDSKSPREAALDVEENDRERAAFIRKLFRRSIDDPSAYDLVINTEHLGADVAASIVALAVMEKFERLRRRAPAATHR